MAYVFLFSFFHYRFAITIPYFGIFMNLQHFGSNIFLFQVIFGALTVSVRSLAVLPLNYMGRRPTQMFLMFLVGISILVNTFVPQGVRRLDFGERKGLFLILQGLFGHTCLKPGVKRGPNERLSIPPNQTDKKILLISFWEKS